MAPSCPPATVQVTTTTTPANDAERDSTSRSSPTSPENCSRYPPHCTDQSTTEKHSPTLAGKTSSLISLQSATPLTRERTQSHLARNPRVGNCPSATRQTTRRSHRYDPQSSVASHISRTGRSSPPATGDASTSYQRSSGSLLLSNSIDSAGSRYE